MLSQNSSQATLYEIHQSAAHSLSYRVDSQWEENHYETTGPHHTQLLMGTELKHNDDFYITPYIAGKIHVTSMGSMVNVDS